MNDSFLVKGDISGIQEFNFNVTSKGAARSLKARTFFMRIVEASAEKLITEYFPNFESVDSGGGNFYLIVNAESKEDFEKKFTEIKGKICLDENLKYLNLSVTLSCSEISEQGFISAYNDVNEKSRKDKLQHFNKIENAHEQVFEAFIDLNKPKRTTDKDRYADLTQSILDHGFYHLEKLIDKGTEQQRKKMAVFGYEPKFTSDKRKESNAILPQIPVWTVPLLKKYDSVIAGFERNKKDFRKPETGNTIEFEYLSAFAKKRTGTDQLGILKLDVDNLGSLFEKMSKEQLEKFANNLRNFFTSQLDSLLDKCLSQTIRKEGDNQPVTVTSTHNDEKNRKEYTVKIKKYETESFLHQFRENIYVVFSGGDDCFIIGGWDAVIEFAIELRKKITAESPTWKKQIGLEEKPLSISAGMILVDAHYPVVEFARLVENELKKAKRNTDTMGNSKDSISFLGKTFTWNEFEELIQLKNTFLDMIISYSQPRAFLQRIIQSFENTDVEYWRKCGKPFHPALLWRFYHHYRDIRHKLYFQLMNVPASTLTFYNYFFEERKGIYERHIKQRFINNNLFSQELPIAARWAEFLTRTKNSDE